MSVFRDLLPASFKGVSFYVTTESLKKGVLRQENIAPILQDNRTLTNIANLPFEITLDICFLGNLAKHKANKFLNISLENSSGILQTPLFGVFKNMQIKDPISLKAEMTEVGIIKTTVTFVEVINLEQFENLFAFVSDALDSLEDLSYDIFDALYVISNLETTINTFKAGVNNLFDLIDIPILLAEDLQNSLKLKDFLKNTQALFLEKTKEIQEFLLENFNLTNRNSANSVENKKLSDINFLENFILLTLTITFMKSSINYSFQNQEEIEKTINIVTNIKQNILNIDILPQNLFESFDNAQNLFSSFLEGQKQGIPFVFEYEAVDESILTLCYKTLGNIEYLEELDKLNNFNNLFKFSGKVKCLKF